MDAVWWLTSKGWATALGLSEEVQQAIGVPDGVAEARGA